MCGAVSAGTVLRTRRMACCVDVRCGVAVFGSSAFGDWGVGGLGGDTEGGARLGFVGVLFVCGGPVRSRPLSIVVRRVVGLSGVLACASCWSVMSWSSSGGGSVSSCMSSVERGWWEL